MKSIQQPQSEQGIVIVITLILLLVMTTMGIALVYTTSRNAERAQGVVNSTEAMFSAESCAQTAMQWLETTGVSQPPCKNSTPGSSCYSVTSTAMNKSNYSIPGLTGTLKTKFNNKMNLHRHSCDISLVTTVSDKKIGKGTGFGVDKDTGYGGKSSHTKYIYKITAEGSGPNESQVNIENIVSMTY